MNFSSRYTRVTISPVSRLGGPVVNRVRITLTMALELNMLSSDVSTAQLASLLQAALNRHAGGTRTIDGVRHEITWEIRWVDASVVLTGAALGVALVTDDVLSRSNADGVFAVNRSNRGENRVSRILLGGGFARQALSNNPSVAQRGRTGFGNAAAHEVGHSQRVSHQPGTLMDDTNTTRLDRFMTDAQIAEILRTHLPVDRSVPSL